MKFLFLFLMGLLLVPSVEAEELPPMPEGPLLLTSITTEQLNPDYWINRLPNPDAPLKTPQELERFNEDIRLTLPSQVDIFQMEGRRRGKDIEAQLELEYETVKGRILYGIDDQRIPETLFENEIKPLMQWKKVPPQIRMRWGVATRPASLRALPSEVKMLEEIGDIEFDQLQYTLIKLWTPVAIYHESSDGEWLYLQAPPYGRGWVKARDIAIFPTRQELKKFAPHPSPLPLRGKGRVGGADFLVVTGESIPIFADPALQKKFQKASMGTILPLAGESADAYEVWMPFRGERGKAFLRKLFVDRKSDVSVGFLPYTQRNVIRQAFKLLGSRYGWGGTYHGRDCSGFTHDVFLPFGIDMPRNSKEQIFVGTQINHFRLMQDPEGKTAAIRAGTPGITLMTMPLHQMLYLGEVNGQFYAIHSTWAERISMTSDEKRRINQVVVSDLTLNGNSYLGSLFDRIVSVTEVN